MMDYERLAASSPVNALAAKQTGRGTGWTPKVKLQDWYDDPPKMVGDGYYREHARQLAGGNREWTDFRGVSVGRLLVVGVVAKASNGPASWACRCKCGCYCTRTARTLRIGMAGGNSFSPVCGRCAYQDGLRHRPSNLEMERLAANPSPITPAHTE